MNLDLSERDNFVLSFYNGKDDLDNSRTMTTPPFLEERGVSFEGDVTDLTEWGNTGFSAGWDRFWSDAFHSRLVLALSNYFNNRDQINNTSITFPEQEDDDFSFPERWKRFARGSVENNDLNDLTVRWDNTLSLGGHEIGLGFQLTSNTITYNFEEDETVDEDEDAEETPQRQLIGVLNRKDEGTAYAFYLQDRWTLFDRLTLTPGLRSTYFDQTEKWYYEPRFSLHMDLSLRFKLKGAWGRYYQIVNRITREDLLRGNREFWALADGEQISVSSAVHAVGGLSYETDDLLFDMEAYFKSLGGLSEFAPRIFTSEDIDYNQFFYQGDGTARGIEFLLQKKTGSLNGWLSYTLAEVEYNFPDLEDEPFPALQDQTHEFKLVGLYEIGDWTFSSTWIYATGKPYTEPVGIEEVEIFNGLIRELVIAGDKNGGRLPAYHRMDLSANYSFSFGDTDKSYLGLTIFNLYDRKNVWYKEFDVLEGEIIESNFNLMGLTFNLFLNVKF
jgi:outer membrane receptor protein involved in Fe transport